MPHPSLDSRGQRAYFQSVCRLLYSIDGDADGGHDRALCPWLGNPSPPLFATIVGPAFAGREPTPTLSLGSSADQLVRQLAASRLQSLLPPQRGRLLPKLHAAGLPWLSALLRCAVSDLRAAVHCSLSTTDSKNEDDECHRVAVCLALCGWQFDPAHPLLAALPDAVRSLCLLCRSCQHVVPLRNYTSALIASSVERLVRSRPLIKGRLLFGQSIDDHQHCMTAIDSAEPIFAVSRDRKRSSPYSDRIARPPAKRHASSSAQLFDPVHCHRSFCPWRAHFDRLAASPLTIQAVVDALLQSPNTLI